MTNKLIHDAALNVTENDVINHMAYPLVRELAFSYGTQIIHTANPTSPNPKFYLAREDGICVGYVLYDKDHGYGFRSVVSAKERGGRRADDRYTWYSTKLAAIMRTIKKDKLIPSGSEKLIQEETKIYNSVINMISSYGDPRKSYGIGGEEAHRLLEIVFGNESPHDLSTESIAKYKEYLDKYKLVDTIREKRRNEVGKFFSQPLWAVCYDEAQSFLVGKLSFSVELDDNIHSGVATVKPDIAQPFKRVHMLDEFPEIMPKITMLKVVMQQRNWDAFHKEVMPKGFSGWIPELSAMSYAARSSWDEGILKGDWLMFHE